MGFVANQPMVLAGVLDNDLRRARLGAVRAASATSFNIPIVTFVDVPGFLPVSVLQEHDGYIIIARRQAASSPTRWLSDDA